MNDILPFFKALLSAPGVSGWEQPVFQLIEQTWKPLVDEISHSRLNSLHAFRKGTGKPPRPALMVAAHMDSIGMIVTGIQNGLIRFSSIGGIDPRVLPGQFVRIHGSTVASTLKESIPGVVVQPHPKLLPVEIRDEVIPMEYLFIDTGLPTQTINKTIHMGDIISFDQHPIELKGETIAGHSLDNRASIAALTVCLQELKYCKHAWDLWMVGTVQEETGYIGANTSAFQLKPVMAVVVDVTWAKGPGTDDWNTFPLGKGITVMMGPNMHPRMHRMVKDAADRCEIPYEVELTNARSGTDAFATQVVGEGIPTVTIGIPIRYMHSPVEVGSIKDIYRAGRLLVEFICSLDHDSLKQLVLDQ